MLKRILLSTTLLVSSCGIINTAEKGKKSEENAPELAGDWKSACVANSALKLSHTQRDFNFNAIGDFDKTESFFKDDLCDESFVTYQVMGTYDEKGENPENADIQMINFTVNEANLTADTGGAVTILNGLKFCGISDWKMGEERNITSQDCTGFKVNKGDVIFESYKLEDNNSDLYLGQKFVFLAKDNSNERPKDVNKNAGFTRE